MHYAVPRILHEAGLLERLFTDLVAVQGWPRSVKALFPEVLTTPGLRRMFERVPQGIPNERITSFPGFGLAAVGRVARAGSESELLEAYLKTGRKFCSLVSRHSLGGIGGVYTFNTAALEILQKTRGEGIRGVVEQTIAPRFLEMRILEEENSAWPGWEKRESNTAVELEFAERERSEWQLADCILCGSRFVADGIRQCGGPAERCQVVPYGVDLPDGPPWPHRRSPSRDLRVLFCGTVGLRKGIPYLLEAAKKLPRTDFSFRVVGALRITDGAQKECSPYLELTGGVARSAMPHVFAEADVLLLPSLCEGSATVCYEALAAGLPVITTENAGSIVRDGIEGFIVPPRNPDAIAEKLEIIRANPAFRQELSVQALARAKSFTVREYGRRLLEALART